MDTAERLQVSLEQALGDLLTGEASEAERRAKAVSALVRAHRDVSELIAVERAKAPKEDEEELRAELRRRLALFVEAERADAPDEVLERIATEASAG